MRIEILFHGNLKELLASDLVSKEIVHHRLDRRASIKDVIESLGIPHPEIARLTVNGVEVPFSYIVTDRDRVEVWPLSPQYDMFKVSVLRPVPLSINRFVVDVNVGKLAILLRMAGFDTLYHSCLTDVELAEISAKKKRILLTRDCSLLKRKKVEFGHLVRESVPEKQLAEIIRLFNLADKAEPFSRCLRCNSLLEKVDKEKVLGRLEPLTRKYFNVFMICGKCDKIYWPGSHRDNMEKYLQVIKRDLSGR